MTRRHVLLVGLPGAGKTTVGQLVAEELGAPFLDIDGILVRQMGMPVSQMFGMLGEPRFRELEREAVASAHAGDPSVIVPGGGWAAQPGALGSVRQASLSIYLRVRAETAARRSEKGEARPLLAGSDPVQRLRELLRAREPYYKLAAYEVSAEVKAPPAVADEVVRLARMHGGW